MSITLEQSYIFSALQGGQGPEFGFELKAGHTKKCIFIFVPGQRRLTHGEQRDQKTPLIRRDSRVNHRQQAFFLRQSFLPLLAFVFLLPLHNLTH